MHTVIVHHIDGECSTEASFESRTEAISWAMDYAKYLPSREYMTVCGYILRGEQDCNQVIAGETNYLS